MAGPTANEQLLIDKLGAMGVSATPDNLSDTLSIALPRIANQLGLPGPNQKLPSVYNADMGKEIVNKLESLATSAVDTSLIPDGMDPMNIVQPVLQAYIDDPTGNEALGKKIEEALEKNGLGDQLTPVQAAELIVDRNKIVEAIDEVNTKNPIEMRQGMAAMLMGGMLWLQNDAAQGGLIGSMGMPILNSIISLIDMIDPYLEKFLGFSLKETFGLASAPVQAQTPAPDTPAPNAATGPAAAQPAPGVPGAQAAPPAPGAQPGAATVATAPTTTPDQQAGGNTYSNTGTGTIVINNYYGTPEALAKGPVEVSNQFGKAATGNGIGSVQMNFTPDPKLAEEKQNEFQNNAKDFEKPEAPPAPAEASVNMNGIRPIDPIMQ